MAREHRVMTALGPTASRSRRRSGCARTSRSTARRSTSWTSSPATSCATPPIAEAALDVPTPSGGRPWTWPTPWPRSTRSTSTTSASATSAGARATSSARSGAGRASTRRWRSTGRTTAAWSEVGAHPGRGGPRAAAGLDRPRRLPARQRRPRRRRRGRRHLRLGDLHARRPAGRRRHPPLLLGRARRRRPAARGRTRPRRPGLPGREELLARYAEASGRDVSDIAYYMAFGYWKLACILQGVYARYRAGAGRRRPEQRRPVPAVIARLARRAATMLAAR